MFKPNVPFSVPLLPPNLPVENFLTPELIQLTIQANRAISELNGLCKAINSSLLMNIPILQESVSSSAIEGIHTTVKTLLEAQVKIEKQRDPASKQALRYKEALYQGLKYFENYNLSTRTILAIHKKLIPYGGQFKKKINHIAKKDTVIYTPPAPREINRLMNNWETYIHDFNNKIDPLITIAISHYQFEAIHPFLDGNGRTGRTLIVLQLVLYKLLDSPILYISGYLLKHRKQYYSSLLQITQSGEWVAFIKFILQAFYEQAKVTKTVISDIIETKKKIKKIIKSQKHFLYKQEILDHIFSYPITYPSFMRNKLNITYQTASKYLIKLEKIQVLKKKLSGTHTLYYNHNLLDCLKT